MGGIQNTLAIPIYRVLPYPVIKLAQAFWIAEDHIENLAVMLEQIQKGLFLERNYSSATAELFLYSKAVQSLLHNS